MMHVMMHVMRVFSRIRRAIVFMNRHACNDAAESPDSNTPPLGQAFVYEAGEAAQEYTILEFVHQRILVQIVKTEQVLRVKTYEGSALV